MIHVCPLCNASGSEEIIRCPDRLVTGEIFAVRHCDACGLLFTADAPGPEAIGRYYASENYESLSGKRSGLRASVRAMRQRIAARFVEKNAGMRSGLLLDIGCGTGDFLEVMRRRGWTASGIEPDERNRAALAARGITVFAPADIAKIPDSSKDVITLWHVLEHVHGLREFGMQLRRILKPGGIVIVAVPNAEAFDAKMYREHWHGYELPRHLYHFTRRTLSRFAEDSGLTVARFGSLPLDSVYCCLKSEEYLKGNGVRGMFRGLATILRSVVRPLSSTTILAVLRRR